MNNTEIKTWAGQEVRNMVSEQLTERAKVDILKGAAITETLLGYFRSYRNEVFNMHFDLDAAVDKLEMRTGTKLSKSQRTKVQDILTSEIKALLISFKKFDAILSEQLGMLNTLPEHKQETLHQLDEQHYEEQQLMRALYDAAIRDGKGMINVNQLKAKLGIAKTKMTVAA